jgi:hypothetical protein
MIQIHCTRNKVYKNENEIIKYHNDECSKEVSIMSVLHDKIPNIPIVLVYEIETIVSLLGRSFSNRIVITEVSGKVLMEQVMQEQTLTESKKMIRAIIETLYVLH